MADLDTALASVRAESPAVVVPLPVAVVEPVAPEESTPCAPEVVGSGDARTVVCRGCGWRTHKPTAERYAKGAKTRHEKDYAAKVAARAAGAVSAAA